MAVANIVSKAISSITGAFAGAMALGAVNFSLAAITAAVPALKDFRGSLTGGLLNAYLSCPLLNFLPIYADRYTVTRDSDVATSLVIAQSIKQGVEGKKAYVTDNCAPRPRVWNVSGYLMPLLPIDGTVFKPTVEIQKFMLDAAALSRQTVVFKTKEGEFVNVLISHMMFEEIAQGQNTTKIEVVLNEFNALTADMLVDVVDMSSATAIVQSVGAVVIP